MQARTAIWFLGGALCASLVLNVVQSRARATAESAPAVVFSTLDLSPEQVQRLVECRDDCCNTQQSLRQQIVTAEAELRTALATANFDVAGARQLAAELGNLRARCLQMGVETILQVREVLTPEQVERLVSCFEQGCKVATRE